MKNREFTTAYPPASGVFPVMRLADLVEACLRPATALEAWNRYARALDGATPDFGETRLYPLVADTLSTADLAGCLRPDMLKKETRRAKVMAAMLSPHLADLCKDLNAAGLRPIFLKGIALQHFVYPQPWLRPAADFDLYIPKAERRRLHQAATRAGWSEIESDKAAAAVASQYWEQTKFEFHQTNAPNLDVHTLPREIVWARPDLVTEFEATLQALELPQLGAIYVPSPAWLLFEAIEHGLYRNAVSPIRWVVDAARIIERVPERDRVALVEAVLDIADRAHCQGLICLGLQHLIAVGAAVPDTLCERIERVAPDSLEAAEIRLRLQKHPPFAVAMRVTCADYLLRSRGWSMAQRIAGLPSYMLRRNRFESVRHALRYESARLVAHIRGQGRA